jgi:hypothetical protein
MAKKKESSDRDKRKVAARKKAAAKPKAAPKKKLAAKKEPKAPRAARMKRGAKAKRAPARAPRTVKRTAAAPPRVARARKAPPKQAAPSMPAAQAGIAFGEPRVINHSQEREVVRAGSSKFEIEPRERFVEPRYVAGEERELPLEYGDTKLVLLVRDPEWVFAYWEIAPALREEMGIPKGKHSKPLALRLYDVTGVDFDGGNAVSFFDVRINDYAVSWYLRVPEADRSYCADLGLFSEQGDFVRIARSNVVTTPRKDVSWETEAEWMRVSEEHFRELFRLSGGFAVKEFAGSEMMLRSLAEMVTQRLASERWGGSEAISSAGAVRTKGIAEKGFWMVVDTDLVVYGATVPGSRVTIEGQEVPLKPDGTFSVRYALRDGEREFTVRAESSDGLESREVTIRVTRETK